jgi:excisionase family DNA binding protein
MKTTQTTHQLAPRAGHRDPLIPTGTGMPSSRLAEPEGEQHSSGTPVHSATESDPDGEGDGGADRRATRRRGESGGQAGWRSHQDGKRALRVNEAVFRYGIGRTNLHRLIKSGALRSVKVGRSRLIPVDALEALLRGE